MAEWKEHVLTFNVAGSEESGEEFLRAAQRLVEQALHVTLDGGGSLLITLNDKIQLELNSTWGCEEEEESVEKQKVWEVVVNGRSRYVDNDILNYASAVELAFPTEEYDGEHPAAGIEFTVTYRRPKVTSKGQSRGILTPESDSIYVSEAMIVNVAAN